MRTTDGLGRLRVHLGQPADLLLELLLDLVGDADLAQLVLVDPDLLLDLGALAELLLDGLHLLAQEVLLLELVHLALGLGRDLGLDVEELELAGQELVDLLQPLGRVGDLEDRLGLLDLELEVRGGQVGQAAGLVDVRGDDEDLGRQVLAERGGPLEPGADVADEGLALEALLGLLGLLDDRDLGGDVGAVLLEGLDPGPDEALGQDAHPAVGELQHAHDQGDRADVVDVLALGVLDLHVLLGQEEDHPVGRQGDVDGVLGFLAPDEERGDHVGEDDDVPQEQDGQLRRDLELGALVLDEAARALRRSCCRCWP